MAEQLQELLAKIQQDGVAKAEAKAKEIIAAAEKRAAAISAEAAEKAKEIKSNAEQNAVLLVDRGKKSLEQAARDVVLSVGESVQSLFEKLARQKVKEALTPDALRPIITKAVMAYLTSGESRLEVVLSPEEKQKIGDLLTAEFRSQVGKSVEIKADGAVVSGFRVSLVKQEIEHDFSAEAIATAIAQLVRPELAAIVLQSVAK